MTVDDMPAAGGEDRYEPSEHRHLPPPAIVIRQAAPRVSGFYGEMTPADAEKMIQALKDAGYSLMQPVCEACDDEASEGLAL